MGETAVSRGSLLGEQGLYTPWGVGRSFWVGCTSLAWAKVLGMLLLHGEKFWVLAGHVLIRSEEV